MRRHAATGVEDPAPNRLWRCRSRCRGSVQANQEAPPQSVAQSGDARAARPIMWVRHPPRAEGARQERVHVDLLRARSLPDARARCAVRLRETPIDRDAVRPARQERRCCRRRGGVSATAARSDCRILCGATYLDLGRIGRTSRSRCPAVAPSSPSGCRSRPFVRAPRARRLRTIARHDRRGQSVTARARRGNHPTAGLDEGR